MKPDLYIPTYTINDWKLWKGDWLLIKGTPVSINPAPFNKHQIMGGDLHTYFFNFKLNESCSVEFDLNAAIEP